MFNWDLFRVYDVHTTGGSMSPTKGRTPGIDCLHEKCPGKKCDINLTSTITLTFITTLNFVTPFFRIHNVTFFVAFCRVASFPVVFCPVVFCLDTDHAYTWQSPSMY